MSIATDKVGEPAARQLLRRWPVIVRKIIATLAILLLILLIIQAAHTGLGNIAYVKAQQESSAWHTRGAQPTMDSILRAETAINTALEFSPKDPDILTLAAEINGWKGFYLARQEGDPALATRHYSHSLALLRRALALRPAHADTWLLIAEYKTLQQERDSEWHQAKEKALEYGGSSSKLVKRILAL